jgi:hypothetical protein
LPINDEQGSEELATDGPSMSFGVESLTYSLAEAARRFPCSERWLAEKIRGGHFDARKICGHWRMTEEDIEYALEQCRNSSQSSPDDNRLGLTSTSRRRLNELNDLPLSMKSPKKCRSDWAGGDDAA